MPEVSVDCPLRPFTVVLRGPSAAVFEESAGLEVKDRSLGREVVVRIRTRWKVLGDAQKLPGHLWLEVSGEAVSLERAIQQFSRIALSLVPVLALSSNAAIGDSEFELAFERTASVNERDFVQHHVAQEVAVLREGRRIDPILTTRLLAALHASTHRERALRAVNQYWMALQNWRFGYEALAVAHLWMAVEALTKAAIRAELERSGLASEAELASEFGVELKRLDGEVRRRLILSGDDDCYSLGKEASDGFEHGYLAFDEVRERAAQIRMRMSMLVRKAILALASAPDEVVSSLLATPFDVPLGNWPMTRVLRGKLVGRGDDLAAPGNAYPFLEWNVNVGRAEPTDGGRVNATMTDSITPRLGNGIAFRPERHELWGVR